MILRMRDVCWQVFLCVLCLKCLDNRVEALIFELTLDLAAQCSILMRESN